MGHLQKFQLRALRANMDNDSMAVLRGASGQGTGAFLAAPSDEMYVMIEWRFTIVCMRRLGCEWPAYSETPHVQLVGEVLRRIVGKALSKSGEHHAHN